jgi:hypothetical protein
VVSRSRRFATLRFCEELTRHRLDLRVHRCREHQSLGRLLHHLQDFAQLRKEAKVELPVGFIDD